MFECGTLQEAKTFLYFLVIQTTTQLMFFSLGNMKGNFTVFPFENYSVYLAYIQIRLVLMSA